MSVTPWLPLARANDITASEQSDPTVVALPDGGYAMVWMTRNGNPALGWAAQLDVMARAFNRDGTPRGPEFTVSTSPAATDNEASIAALPDGNLAVVWHLSGDSTLPPETAGTELRFRVVTQDGTEVVPVTSLGQGASDPEIATLADGRFVTVWSNTVWLNPETPVRRVLAQAWTAAGDAAGGRIVVSEGSGSNTNEFARVAGLADGGFIAVWNVELRAGWWEPSRLGLRARVYDSDGVAVGPVFAPIADESYSQADGQPVGLADGGFAIAWWRGQPGTGGDIWTRSFDADGTPRGAGVVIHADPFSGGQASPAIAALPDGGYAVAWRYPDGVWLRLIDADGTPRGAEAHVMPERIDSFPVDQNITVAVLADGRIVVAAQGYTAGSDIWHKIVDPRGAAIAGTGAADDVLGNTLDNAITGLGGNDRLDGREGADRLDGGRGDDTLAGGAGDDTLTGGAGADAMAGGAGDDRYGLDDPGDSVTEAAGEGFDTVEATVNHTLAANVEALVLLGRARQGTGNAADNRIDGNARDNVLRGLGGDDTLRGGDGADRVLGSTGRDSLAGDAGADRLEGGSSADMLDGGDGDDVLIGGTRRDAMTGGAGRDVFVFAAGDSGATRAGADRIADFAPDADVLDLSGVAAGLAFDGGGALTGLAGQVVHLRAAGLVVVDIDGDGAADLAIRLDNRPAALDADAFIL